MPPKRKKQSIDDDEDYVDEGNEEYDNDIDIGNIIRANKRSKTNSAVQSKRGRKPLISDDFSESDTMKDYSKELVLKPDHEKRPIWITKDNLIMLEAFSPIYQQAYDFLVAVAEPESRPEFIHCYRLTENSLYAAVAVSIDTESIIRVLDRLCKTNVPKEVVNYIKECTYTFGKAKIVLKDNKFHVESQYPEILRELLKNPTIANSRVIETEEETTENETEAVKNKQTENFTKSVAPTEDRRNLDYTKIGIEEMDNDEDEFENNENSQQTKLQTVSFTISRDAVQTVKRSSKEESKYPLMEEYDFKNDHRNPTLPIDLRPSTKIRPYQEKSLSKMFGNGRARSGIIVLPCGAGKSLTGVTAASTIKKTTMVLCINNASVKQWKEQFLMWTNVPERCIKLFTSAAKEVLPSPEEACIVITTYSMICHGGRRSASGELMIQSVGAREWGLMILDEVHVAPADMFQKVVHMVNAHCKLGLTATLVREDNKIKDLSFIVGPKLYEANWIDLTNDGYLARVKCCEVWCPMTKEFYAEYIRRSIGSNSRVQRLLYTLNPRKFRACEYLVNYHSKKGDKIIIFSDDVPALILYCEALKAVKAIPYIYGGTKEHERRDILTAFKTRVELNCIGLSKVGDTALDIPEANVIIQVSSHFGARRQEAQRLGRILRPKPNPTGGFNAFFYTLISTDTKEMYFSSKRQQYLIDQGYTFKIYQDIADKADRESILLSKKQQEIDLLHKVISFNYESYDQVEDRELSKKFQGELEDDDLLEKGNEMTSVTGGATVVRRKSSNLSSVSGVGKSVYMEYEAN